MRLTTDHRRSSPVATDPNNYATMNVYNGVGASTITSLPPPAAPLMNGALLAPGDENSVTPWHAASSYNAAAAAASASNGTALIVGAGVAGAPIGSSSSADDEFGAPPGLGVPASPSNGTTAASATTTATANNATNTATAMSPLSSLRAVDDVRVTPGSNSSSSSIGKGGTIGSGTSPHNDNDALSLRDWFGNDGTAAPPAPSTAASAAGTTSATTATTAATTMQQQQLQQQQQQQQQQLAQQPGNQSSNVFRSVNFPPRAASLVTTPTTTEPMASLRANVQAALTHASAALAVAPSTLSVPSSLASTAAVNGPSSIATSAPDLSMNRLFVFGIPGKILTPNNKLCVCVPI
jgi:hypothetical protein